ncbi:MAG: sigma-54-dependent Fis family transcriptional regulator [Spartobacteria bacterium AMD-G4]|jgi:DNA-binding NtrC family response regulator|nr:MAG: sigma-54-dependent Fis family transcriptional regulator [Spartobacteria bacterium AMD-G4]
MALDRILIVDDTAIIRKSLEERLRGKRYAVSTAGSIAEAEKRLAANSFDLIFLDMELPDGDGSVFIERLSHTDNKPLVVMITANGAIESVVECMRSGAFDYLTKPFAITQIDLILKKAAEFQRAVRVTDFLNRESVARREIIGKSPAISRLKDLIHRVGRTNATVMISGENGTGKELVANDIFLNSQRTNKPFIKVNCAAISEALIESEFFGHEKGSFTGATDQRDGRFELADGGTILLDEVSEISLGLQAKLLRVLQEREFERVGGNKTIKVDVRVLATTNRDLLKAVQKGDFREDLYYRLNVFPIQVPPLRERTGDVEILANHFLDRFAKEHGIKSCGFSESGMAGLIAHNWPGNVRELQNVVERAAILAEEGVPISAELMGLTPPAPAPPAPIAAPQAAPVVQESAAPAPTSDSQVMPLHELEKRAIFEALERTNGNRTQAAELLQISIRTLRNKLAEYRGDNEEAA